MPIKTAYLKTLPVCFLLTLSTVGCGVFKSDKNSSNDDGKVGENFEMKPVNTKEWNVWYPVPKNEEPKFEMIDGRELTTYRMASPVTDSGEILFGFLEGSCQSVSTRIASESANSEVLYKLKKINNALSCGFIQRLERTSIKALQLD